MEIKQLRMREDWQVAGLSKRKAFAVLLPPALPNAVTVHSGPGTVFTKKRPG